MGLPKVDTAGVGVEGLDPLWGQTGDATTALCKVGWLWHLAGEDEGLHGFKRMSVSLKIT